MKTKPFHIALVTLVAIGLLAGCHDRNCGLKTAYCDDSGCFECDENKNCWPVPNKKCVSDDECNVGDKCTNIGCAALCTSDDQCTGDNICVGGFCAPSGFTTVEPFVPPTSCEGDQDCGSDEFCEAGKCLAKCKSDDDCGTDMVCSSCGKCQPKGTPATCGDTQLYCSDTVACGDGKSCMNNRCHYTCTGSETCPIGQVCDSGLCQDDPSPSSPECSLDLDCADGSCINGYCHISCGVTADCGQGELCMMGICQPDYHPVK